MAGAWYTGVTTSADDKWPMFSFDEANTGHHPTATGPTDSVQEGWDLTTGNDVFSSPAVTNGAVYVGSDGWTNDNVYGLDAATGEVEWNFSTNYTVETSPAAADGTVYLWSGEGDVCALEGESPFFTVAIDEIKSPVTEGEELVVNATVENTGEMGDVQDNTLEIERRSSLRQHHRCRWSVSPPFATQPIRNAGGNTGRAAYLDAPRTIPSGSTSSHPTSRPPASKLKTAGSTPPLSVTSN